MIKHTIMQTKTSQSTNMKKILLLEDTRLTCPVNDDLGMILAVCLQELVEVHPIDPIEYISQWLYKYANSRTYFHEKHTFYSVMGKTYALFEEQKLLSEKNKKPGLYRGDYQNEKQLRKRFEKVSMCVQSDSDSVHSKKANVGRQQSRKNKENIKRRYINKKKYGSQQSGPTSHSSPQDQSAESLSSGRSEGIRGRSYENRTKRAEVDYEDETGRRYQAGRDVDQQSTRGRGKDGRPRDEEQWSSSMEWDADFSDEDLKYNSKDTRRKGPKSRYSDSGRKSHDLTTGKRYQTSRDVYQKGTRGRGKDGRPRDEEQWSPSMEWDADFSDEDLKYNSKDTRRKGPKSRYSDSGRKSHDLTTGKRYQTGRDVYQKGTRGRGKDGRPRDEEQWSSSMEWDADFSDEDLKYISEDTRRRGSDQRPSPSDWDERSYSYREIHGGDSDSSRTGKRRGSAGRGSISKQSKARWALTGSPPVMTCFHPILGILRSPHRARERADIFWGEATFACEALYDQEIYTNCKPDADDHIYKDRMLEWTGRTWIFNNGRQDKPVETASSERYMKDSNERGLTETE